MSILLGVLALLAIVLLIAGILAFAIRGMSSGRKHGTSGSLSGAMLEVHSLLEPEKKKAVETMRAQEEEEDEDEIG